MEEISKCVNDRLSLRAFSPLWRWVSFGALLGVFSFPPPLVISYHHLPWWMFLLHSVMCDHSGWVRVDSRCPDAMSIHCTAGDANCFRLLPRLPNLLPGYVHVALPRCGGELEMCPWQSIRDCLVPGDHLRRPTGRVSWVSHGHCRCVSVRPA